MNKKPNFYQNKTIYAVKVMHSEQTTFGDLKTYLHT